MYLPAHFTMSDADAVDAARARGFGTLVVAGVAGLEASPLPFVVDADEAGIRVRAHVAKANPIVAALPAAAALLAVELADAYVSPGWYRSKAEHQRVVPTWNYVAVHLHGTARTVADTEWLRLLVNELTERHEATMAAPWSVADAPDDYLDAMLRAIVGVEVRVDRVEGKAKLSQNRPAADALGAVAGLRAVGRDDMADRMVVEIEEGDA
ncbi:MAG: FMN-binding negative transcriptional regulator [Ilumatobacteraceae bacterium]